MFRETFDAIRNARRWSGSAPQYRGEFVFGPDAGAPAVFGVFGDSVGCGLGASGVERTFAGAVARRLAENRRVICRISAVSGARGRDLASQRLGAADERFVAVSIGTNDILHGDSMSDLERAVSLFLEGLRGAERVVVLGPGDLASALILPAALRPILTRRVRACEAALRRATGRFDNALHLAPRDVFKVLTPGHFAVDGFHPSEEAHALIGEAVYSRLTA